MDLGREFCRVRALLPPPPAKIGSYYDVYRAVLCRGVNVDEKEAEVQHG